MWAYAIKAWFWDQTVAGETLFAAYRAGLEHPDKAWSGNPRSLVPGDLRSQGAGGVVALSAGHRGGDHIRRSGRSP